MAERNIGVAALEILNAGQLEIRDVNGGEKPFLYASGNWGPGYLSVKSLVGRKEIIRYLVRELAEFVAKRASRLDFIAGNVTGGLVPGWVLSEYLEPILRRTVPFVYVRDTRKKGGQKELVTGDAHNPKIRVGNNVLVVEELVNFAHTTCNSAIALREKGYTVTHAACILFYQNPKAIAVLKQAGIEMIYLLTLLELLDVAEKHNTHPKRLIEEFRVYLKDPLAWQEKRELKPVKEGGTR
ncbi:hypothetical protein IIA95_03575 [Patescibacteria group bacterium]|nr:hypothetical protein [Patescibacteria group bacterium]